MRAYAGTPIKLVRRLIVWRLMNVLMDAKHTLMLSETGGGEQARLVMSLLTTTRRIDAACAALLSRHGLSEGLFAALLAVKSNPGITPGGLASEISVTRATVTGLVDGLARRDLLQRTADPADRRSQTLQLTGAGATLVQELSAIYSTWMEQLTAGITDQQRHTVFGVLGAVQANVRGGDNP